MVQLVEMDSHTSFMRQLGGVDDGPVILANHFTMAPEDEDEFLRLWVADAQYMLGHGCRSGQLHKGTEGSLSYFNYAVWDKLSDLAAAFRNPEFQELIGRYPASVTASPHVFKKFAIPGVCEA